jgi:hypothetical protein
MALYKLKLSMNRYAQHLLVIFCFICAGIAPAKAAVWGYVDAQGQVHLANERVDERYELFFNPTTAQADPAVPNAPNPPKGKQKLWSFFESSAEFKTLKPLLREAAEKHKLEPELLQALIAVESGYNKRAVSPKGALGLMQIMPATAARFGIAADKKRTIEDRLFDARTNLGTGARYLALLKGLFPNRLDLVLASYNAGEGAVQKYKNAIPPYPETQAYVQTVTEIFQALKPPAPPAPPAYIPANVRLQLPLMNARRNMPDYLPPRSQGRVSGTMTNTKNTTQTIATEASDTRSTDEITRKEDN